MFIEAVLTIAKTRNQPKCPLMINWKRKMWHIYTMEYYAAVKKKDEFMSFVHKDSFTSFPIYVPFFIAF